MFQLMIIIIICGLSCLQIAPAISVLKSPGQITRAPRDVYEPCRGKEAGKFVKDPYACDKFFYCGPDEQPIVVDCPRGMIFNDEKEICDFPSNYLCVPLEKEEEENTSTSSVTEPQTLETLSTRKEVVEDSSTTVTQTLETLSSQKGVDEDSSTTHTQTTLETLSTSRKDTTVSSSTTTSTMPTTTITTTEESHKSDCPVHDTKELIFLPHKSECHRYYICYHGAPFAQECIKELHWNPKTNRCDFPEKAGCLAPTTIPPTTASVSVVVPKIRCPFRGEQILPHPVHCNYFIYCVNGYATVQQCPFYHHFDIRSRRCLWETVAQCLVTKSASKKQ